MPEYTGVRELIFYDEQINQLKGKRSLYPEEIGLEDLKINEYIIIKDENEEYLSYKYRFNGEKLAKLNYEPFSNTYVGDIHPRNAKQELLFDLLCNDSIPIKLITGSMGSGKTYISINSALHKIQQKNNGFEKMVYIRNNVEVANTEKLGALPNGLRDKLLPFILPIQDCLGGSPDQLEFLEKSNLIEYVHLGHCRGRNFSNSIIIASECENLTREHVQMLIGRVGENSIIIFEGDLLQTDKTVFEKNNGIRALRDVLGGHQMFGCVELDKSERSKVSELAKLF